MAKPSAYVARIKEGKQEAMSITERVTRQMMFDTLQVTLNEFGWGYDRIKPLCDRWQENYDEYSKALRPTKDDEADVAQEHLDREIKRIINGKQDFFPFYERYPDIVKVKY